MVLKFYSVAHPIGCTATVALILAEKQIPFEHFPVDLMKGEQKDPDYVKNFAPFGRVPAIDDDGFILYESRAICRYLEAKYPGKGKPLIPPSSDLNNFALFEQGASVEACDFYPRMLKLGHATVVPGWTGQPVDQALADSLLAEFVKTLDVYEVILSKQRFIGGNEFTMADLFHYNFTPVLPQGGIHIMTSEERPNVARWWKELIARPSWIKLVEGGIKST